MTWDDFCSIVKEDILGFLIPDSKSVDMFDIKFHWSQDLTLVLDMTVIKISQG